VFDEQYSSIGRLLAKDISDMIGYGNTDFICSFAQKVITTNWSKVIQYIFGTLVPILLYDKRFDAAEKILKEFNDYYLSSKKTTNCLLYLQFMNLYYYLFLADRCVLKDIDFTEYLNCIEDAKKSIFLLLRKKIKK
jgi:hypothetical protein